MRDMKDNYFMDIVALSIDPNDSYDVFVGSILIYKR